MTRNCHTQDKHTNYYTTDAVHIDMNSLPISHSIYYHISLDTSTELMQIHVLNHNWLPTEGRNI